MPGGRSTEGDGWRGGAAGGAEVGARSSIVGVIVGSSAMVRDLELAYPRVLWAVPEAGEGLGVFS